MTKDALAAGRPVNEVLNEGLIAGMSVVGEDFKHNVLYVPEVLIAARAMKAGMAVLKPLLSAKDSGVERVGVLLMGNVNPLEIAVRGTPEEVREATLDVLEGSEGEGVILSVGGGVSPGMPRENVVAMLNALDEFNAGRA